MKRFTFRLDALLALRKQEEEQVKLRLAGKNREIVERNRELGGIHEELRQLQASEKARRAGGTPVLVVRYGIAYRHRLKADILATARRIDDLRAEAEMIRRELVEATRAVRALELVRDRRYSEWKRSYQRSEQQFIDEVATRSHGTN